VRRAPDLADPLALMRALRPLAKRTVPGVTGTELDEERTVAASVEQRVAVPVLTPRRSRWIDLALVVDTHHSMLLWHDLVTELSRTVQRAGVFRDVRTWFLSGTDGTSPPRIASARGGEARSPQEVADPTGHRLTVVLTDGVAPGWGSGALHDVLRHWAVHSPLCMVQVLPRRLWGSTSLPTTGMLVQASQPAAPNASWRLLPARARRRRSEPRQGGPWPPEPAGTIAVPVVEATAPGLGSLASIVTGGGRWHRTSCLAVPRAHAPVEEPPAPAPALSGPAALRRFHETASPLALELAGYLSAVPLTLPVMTLVRRVMLPHAEHGHLAEVALGGLLLPWEQAGDRPDDMSVFAFDFLPGVREALLGAQLRHDVTAVQELVRRRMGRHLERRATGPGTDFTAVRVGPGEPANGAGRGRAVGAGAVPFAESIGAPRHVTPVGQTDAMALGVHPVVFTDRARPLPHYVERDHDARLRTAVRRAASGDRARIVLVGGALSGKTRSAWEAIRALLPGWQVCTPDGGTSGQDAVWRVGPETVLWLDGLERFPAVETLLRSTGAPRLVLATVRPEHWERMHQDPAWKGATVIHVPHALTAAEVERARSAWAGSGHPVLDAVLELAGHGGGFEGLTVGPAFLDAYENADEMVRVLVDAAVGARSLGCRAPLPARVLVHAARDYLSGPADGDIELLQALERATAPVVGGIPLLATHLGRDEMVYFAHDVALNMLAVHPTALRRPSLLRALGNHASRLDLAAVIQSARQLGLTLPQWPTKRLGPPPSSSAVCLWDQDRPLCSGVLLGPALVTAPAGPLGEPVSRLRVSRAGDPAAALYEAGIDWVDEVTGLALVSVTDVRWPQVSSDIAALSRTDPVPGQRFTVVGRPPEPSVAPAACDFLDTTVVAPDTLKPQSSAPWTTRTVTGAPVLDERGYIAGVVTSVTDAGLTLVTGRRIDAARGRAPQQPSQDRQPEGESVGRRGTTQWGDDGLDDRIPFLARLEQQDRADLLALGSEITYNARTPLLRQHEPSNHILIILSGWTKVTAATASGYEALLSLRGSGDLVGEEAVLTGRPRSTTVTALEPVRARAVPGDRFMGFLQRHPGVSYHLLGLTSDRAQAADRRRLELASMSVRERFASLLLDLARTHGRRTEEGIELALPLTTQELAGSVGASRETTQRLLRELRERNIVTTGRRRIEVLRPDQLRALAGPGGSPGGSVNALSPSRGQESAGSGLSKGIQKVEVTIKWDPSPAGQPPTNLDLVAAAYAAGDPYGDPAYAVHFGSRSPDSTMHLNRTSNDGAGFGWDEVMTLELGRLADRYARVVVGVVIQQRPVHRTFAGVLNPALRIREGYTVLDEDDFSGVLEATAVTVAEFVRDESGSWTFRAGIRGIEAFDGGTASFTAVMGRMRER
jgi:CRP-like cAMP-binding protein/stress response protein SCP2